MSKRFNNKFAASREALSHSDSLVPALVPRSLAYKMAAAVFCFSLFSALLVSSVSFFESWQSFLAQEQGELQTRHADLQRELKKFLAETKADNAAQHLAFAKVFAAAGEPLPLFYIKTADAQYFVSLPDAHPSETNPQTWFQPLDKNDFAERIGDKSYFSCCRVWAIDADLLPPNTEMYVESNTARILAAQIKQTARRALVFGFFIALLSGMLAVTFSRVLTQRLARLTQAIRRFHEAGEELPLPLRARDEIGDLARSFEVLRQRMNQAVVSQHLSSLQEKEAKDRLQAIFDSAADAIITIDERGCIFSFNKAAEYIFGYSESEMLGQPVNRLMPDFHAQRHDGYIHNYLATGQAKIIGKHRELAGLRKNGEEFYMQLAVSHVKTAEGHVFTGIVSDISLRKEKERQLNEARKYIDGITNAVPTLLCYIDANKVFRFANKSYQSWFSVAFEKIPGQTLAQVVSAPNSLTMTPYIERALAGEFNQSELQIRLADGSARFVRATFTPDISSEGQFDGVFIGLEDLSEIKARKDQLKVLSSRMEFALKAPGIGIWDYSAVSGEMIWDARMYQLYGIAENDPDSAFAGNMASWENCIHPDDRKKIKTDMACSLSTGKDFHAEFRIAHPAKGLRYIEANAKVLYNDAGDIVQMIGTCADVTQRVELIQQRELALKKANEAARLKADFLASMSHEIRTPMNGVIGMLGLLKRSEMDEKQHRYLEIARSSAQSLLTIINDILDFSKIEAGKMELEVVDFDLRNLLGDIAESLALKAQEKGLEIILDVCRVYPSWVKGDPGRLRQILINLLGNAIKFTEQGEIIIRAEMHEQDNGELRFLCAVEDTGIGIPADKIGKIFDSFSQVDTSTTRKYGGTGLGLSIATKLCALMKGSIRAESEEGVGSCFSFDIPLQPSEKASQIPADLPLQGIPVLIVDDNDTLRAVLKKQLSFWGAQVDDVPGVDAAWALLQTRCRSARPLFRIIFIDMNMPQKSGVELARLLLDDQRFVRVKRVMMAAMNYSVADINFSSLGFDGYFFKPVTIQDLRSAFALVLDETPPSDAQQAATETGAAPVKREPQEQRHSLRILVVEDNSVNVDVVMGMLEDIHFTADACGNGVEALAALASAPEDAPYGLIFMDCQMPEMDGYQTTMNIRNGQAGARYISVPIIAMTANAMKGDREKCLAAGMNDYMSKPIDIDALETILKRLSAERELLNAAASPPPKATATAQTFSGTSTVIALQPSKNPDIKPEKTANPTVKLVPTTPFWDRDLALRRVAYKPERMVKLIRMFMDSMPQRVEDLCAAIENDIPDLIIYEAHTIKGVAGNLAALQLMDLTRNIENHCRMNPGEKVSALVPLLRQVFNDTLFALQSWLDEQDLL